MGGIGVRVKVSYGTRNINRQRKHNSKLVCDRREREGKTSIRPESGLQHSYYGLTPRKYLAVCQFIIKQNKSQDH